MGSWPAPTRGDLKKFCEVEGWALVRGATGGTVRHHLTFELALPDGRILRTRISRPPHRETYGPGIWTAILRDQIQVDEATFWACVRDGQKPDRGHLKAPAEALPTELVHMLRTTLHLPDSDIVRLTKSEAVRLLQQHWSSGD